MKTELKFCKDINVKPGPLKSLLVIQFKYALRECNVTTKKTKRSMSPERKRKEKMKKRD